MSPDRPAAVVVLAAGEGTRMKSSIPKVLHAVGGRTLVSHAVSGRPRRSSPTTWSSSSATAATQVTAHLAEVAPKATTAVQDQQLGTGHAVPARWTGCPQLTGTVVVTYGDVPLLTADTLRALLDDPRRAAATPSPCSPRRRRPDRLRPDRARRRRLGRARSSSRRTRPPTERAIREINSGIYAFDAAVLRDALGRLDTDNAQGELYLTDVLAYARGAGGRVGALVVEDVWQIEGVNDRVQLAALHRELNRRTVEALDAGRDVTVVDPAHHLDRRRRHPRARHPARAERAAARQHARRGRRRRRPQLPPRRHPVGRGRDRLATPPRTAPIIGPEATVGPYSYLRPGTRLGRGAKAGGFVEMKKAELGDGAKVPHLSYVGDATIGEGANIGAGTIFANYDGVAKHHTTVGAHSFVGSDSVLVAPVTVADGAYVAAGSTITNDVAPGELAVARAKQRGIAGWVARRRAGTRTAEAAERAAARADDKGDEERSGA